MSAALRQIKPNHLRDLALRRLAEPDRVDTYPGSFPALKYNVAKRLVGDFEARMLTEVGQHVADLVLAEYPLFPDDFQIDHGVRGVKAVRAAARVRT